ncbi:MAG: hypothetical protein FJ149_02320 [Euryarchaeota archaeon]|nr:hypothetical protein [Euryarchaeota archaeon]
MAKKEKGRHYPPSYLKYKGEHPTISIVLTTEMRALLDKMKGARSYREFLYDWIVTNIDELATKIADKKKVEFFSVPCAACHDPVILYPNKSREVRERAAKAFNYVIHEKCGIHYIHKTNILTDEELNDVLAKYGITPRMIQRQMIAEAAKRLGKKD